MGLPTDIYRYLSWKTPEWVIVLGMVIAMLGGIALFFGAIVYSVDRSIGPAPVPAYSHGQMVRFKMARDIEGMVVTVWCSPGASQCRYGVRTRSLSLATQTRLFGADGDVKIGPMTLLNYIREFELEPA